MNPQTLSLGESVVIKASKPIDLAPGQKWINHNDQVTLVKKIGRSWVTKDRFGDQRKVDETALIQKLLSKKFKPLPKSRFVQFANEFRPIARKYFNSKIGDLLLRGIIKMFASNQSLIRAGAFVDASKLDAVEIGDIQNEALATLTGIYADLNTLSRETLSSAPSEIREKAIRLTNEVQELLSLMTSRMPRLKE